VSAVPAHLSDLKSERYCGQLNASLPGSSMTNALGRPMRTMNLPGLPIGPVSVEECIKLYLSRLPADETPWPEVSPLLTAYMAWPNDEAQRGSFVATYLTQFIQDPAVAADEMIAADHPRMRDRIAFEKFGGLGAIARAAFARLIEEIVQVQSRWLLVADIYQLIVDMAYDDRIVLRRGASISKAVELCEIERKLPGHSQLRGAWSDFRDVAHLIAASAHLAHQGSAAPPAAHEASILKAIWIAPEAVVSLAAGYQQFGLEPKTVRKEAATLPPDTLWRIPPELTPEKPFIVFRRLMEAQLEHLRTRRARRSTSPRLHLRSRS